MQAIATKLGQLITPCIPEKIQNDANGNPKCTVTQGGATVESCSKSGDQPALLGVDAEHDLLRSESADQRHRDQHREHQHHLHALPGRRERERVLTVRRP